MEFHISPQEGPLLADSNQFVIRTRVPYKEITDMMISKRVAAVGLKVGDVLLVQCYDHGYQELWHETEYRVVGRSEKITVIQLTDRDSKQVNQVTFEVARCRPWWSSPAGARQDASEEELLGSDPALVARWNPGKKVFEVYRGDELVAEDRDKDAALEKAA